MKSLDWSDPYIKLIGAVAAAIVTVATALAALGVIGIHTGERETETVKVPEPVAAVPENIVVDGADADTKIDDVVPLGPAAREVTADLIEENIGSDVVVTDPTELRGDEPDDAPVAQLQPPFASEEVPGCKTRFLPTNWSYRNGVTPKWMAPHFAANRDIPNSRAEVDGLTGYGSNPAARVSWHFNLDKDGNCDYNVPIRYKAWTISNANPYSINFEVSGSGEAPYLRRGGYKQLARIWIYVHEAYPGIPLRVGSVSNCSSGAAGWITHWMTGDCGGNHSDISPHKLAEVVAKVRHHVRLLQCGERCKARQRQRRVVEARVRRHAETHADYQREKCRGRMHEVRPRTLRRPECRAIKEKGREQHAGIRRARKKLRAI